MCYSATQIECGVIACMVRYVDSMSMGSSALSGRHSLWVGMATLMASVLLAVTPAIPVAGLSVWLYLIPGLFAAYLLPTILLGGLVVVAAVVVILVLDVGSSLLPAEALVSGMLVMSVAWWRLQSNRELTLLVAVSLLTFVFYPLLVLLHKQWLDQSLDQALLNGTRYALSTLLCIVLTEVIVVSICLSRVVCLRWPRAVLNYRPGLVHVVELIVSIAICLCLVLTLSMFWRTWQQSWAASVKTEADQQFESLFISAEATTLEKIRMAARWAVMSSQSDIESRNSLNQSSLLSILEIDDSGSLLGLAIVDEGGTVAVNSSLDQTLLERAVTFARAQRDEGLLYSDFRLKDASKRPALIAVFRHLPDVVLVFSTADDARRFAFSAAFDAYRKASNDPVYNIAMDDTLPEPFSLPEGAEILSKASQWVVWRPPEAQSRYRDKLNAIDQSTRVSLAPSETLVERYSRVLPAVANFRSETSFIPFFAGYAHAVIVTTAVWLAILSGVLWAARFLIGRLIQPLAELTSVFNSWRDFRGGELGSETALKAIEPDAFSDIRDIHRLQNSFRSLAQDIIYGERRLSTIAANYDELLRSLPLGVLAIDGASRVQFLNDALGEMTEQRQEAIARLKTQAALMLATNTTVEEWQLTLEDRPPKTLLLVVNHRLDERGNESGLWVIATDMTQQKQTNAQLIQASKLATLGEMSTGMAHELNQPLNVISLAISNLRFSIKKGKATPESTTAKLDRIDAAVHRAASIIDHMRAYGRLASEGLTRIDVADTVSGAYNLLREQMKLVNVELINQVRQEGLWINGNTIQLEQVLINLINNAKDAIRENSHEGIVTVDAEMAGLRVMIRVSDTGGGIPDHVLPHIFEPFFTTKPVGKGTGLGGSISYGIIREMQGDIWAENISGGAQITISLPLMVEQTVLA